MRCRSRVVLLVTLAVLLAPALSEGGRKARTKRIKRMSETQLIALVRAALSPRASLARLARRIDRRLRVAAKLPFVVENTDELHPGLSTPWDLPKAEWPRRAVLRFDVRVLGKQAELRLVAPLAALQQDKRAAVATATDTNLILMLTAKRRSDGFSLRRIERLTARLRTSVYMSGRLGVCKPAKEWCYTRRHELLARGRKRSGKLMLELAAPSGDVGGIKIVTLPDAKRR